MAQKLSGPHTATVDGIVGIVGIGLGKGQNALLVLVHILHTKNLASLWIDEERNQVTSSQTPILAHTKRKVP